MERDPSGGREQTEVYPDIRFLPDYEGVEDLTYQDAGNQFMLYRDDLPPPVRNLMMQVEGSSDQEGSYTYRGDINLLPTHDGDGYAESAFLRFADANEARRLPNDDIMMYVFDSAEDYLYLMYLDSDGVSMGIVTAGAVDGSLDLVTQAHSRLQHDVDPATDALLDFLLQQKRLLSELYQSYGLPIPPLRLTVAPYETPVSAPAHVEKRPKLSDFGGLEDEKAQLEEAMMGLKHPEVLIAWGVERPNGVLLYGPPGTGKTTLVEAMANELKANLIKVKADQIYGKWMGDSERNFQGVINRAMAATRPTVLLFDEIDTIIRPNAGSAYATVAGMFKQNMGDISAQNPNVMVVATTNEPDNMDEALIRDGRFDLKLYIPNPDGNSRRDIFLKKISAYAGNAQRSVFDILDLETEPLVIASDGMSGASIGTVLKKLVAARAVMEVRTRIVPPPITTQEIVDAIHRHRQTQT